MLHVFAAQLRDDLAASMREPHSRRYWGAYQIDTVTFSRAEQQEPARWLSFDVPSGKIGFSLERQVLLSVLNYRYSRSGSKPLPPQDPATVRITGTEERLVVVLGQHLAGALAERVRLNLAAAGHPAPGLPDDWKAMPGAHPVKGSWVICVAVSDVAAGVRGNVWFSLDKSIMTAVLHGLLPERIQAKRAPQSVRPLASRLQVTLQGRLLSKEMPLGSLFELRVGDVIPVSLNRTDVLLDESRLFTAAVSEHKGKLCLTSFEDAE